MSSDPVPITGLIDRVLGRLARTDIAPVVRLRLEWDDVAGPWATRCRPVSLHGGVLSVVVVSGLEATRLRYDAASLVSRADTALGGGGRVTALAIRVATPAEQAAARRTASSAAGPEAPPPGPAEGSAEGRR